MERQQPDEVDREEEIKDSEGVEKVLIERDGKFELVNASDMAAVDGGSQADGGAGGGEGEPNCSRDNPGVELSDPKENVSESTAGVGHQPTPDSPSHGPPHHDPSTDPAPQKSVDPLSVTDVSSNLPEPPQDTSSHDSEIITTSDSPGTLQDPSSTDAKSASEPPVTGASDVKGSKQGLQPETHDGSKPNPSSEELKSGSRVQIMVPDHIPGGVNKNLSSASTANLGRSSSAARRRQASVNRAVSAPGLRARDKNGGDEEARMRRERNEATFAAWLARKNSDLRERRYSEKSKTLANEEELKLKRERSEAAFQAWLSSKKHLKSQEQLSRPVASIVHVSEEEHSTAFTSWVNKKQRQRQLDKELELKRNAEQEDAAGKVAPDLVQQAYKEWLHKKKVQAHEEAKKKEQYRRSYFSQSKRLRQSLTLRFEGF